MVERADKAWRVDIRFKNDSPVFHGYSRRTVVEFECKVFDSGCTTSAVSRDKRPKVIDEGSVLKLISVYLTS